LILVISSIGYETKEVYTKGNNFYKVTLERVINSLDQMVVIAYGRHNKKTKYRQCEQGNCEGDSYAAGGHAFTCIRGRVPGLIITQSSGYAGGAIGIQLRGQIRLCRDHEPLLVIDGIPLATQNNSINQITNAQAHLEQRRRLEA
jgi:hypothetical protein